MRVAPAVPSPAATVLLLRDGMDGIEVFMVLRSRKMTFSTGALVFPGGKVDPADGAPIVGAGATGSDLTLRVAAIREAFEETGVLLARPRNTRDVLTATRAACLRRRYRRLIHDGELGVAEMLDTEGLELALDQLVPFGRWITPERSPRRFDTYFFLAPAPPGQTAEHDGSESVDSLWITPEAALADARAGRRPVLFPTRANLSKLARSRTVAEALASARRDRIVTVMTRLEQTPDGPMLRIPRGIGYDFTEMRADERHLEPRTLDAQPEKHGTTDR